VVATDAATCTFPTGCMQQTQGYVLDHGTITPTPSFDDGGHGSTAMAINGSNVVVGRAAHSQYPQGPFGYTWDGTTVTDVGDAINDYGDMYWSYATGINALGHVVGTASGGYHDAEAFLFRNGLMTIVPPLPQSYINGVYVVLRVNNKDHVAGTSLLWSDDSHHAFISRKGVTTPLAPDSARSEAYAINDSDEVVGFIARCST
jgi:probable HAF family extracellular repeat protein